MDVFNEFYVRIEEIQGNYFKTEHIEPIKCDSVTKDLIDHNALPFCENSADDDGFDNISVESHYFDNGNFNNNQFANQMLNIL